MTYLLDTNAIGDLMRAVPEIENWMAALDADDRVVICTIVRGEILFGIGKLPEGRRRAERDISSWLPSVANRYRNSRATSTLPSNLPANNAASRWMRATFG